MMLDQKRMKREKKIRLILSSFSTEMKITFEMKPFMFWTFQETDETEDGEKAVKKETDREHKVFKVSKDCNFQK